MVALFTTWCWILIFAFKKTSKTEDEDGYNYKRMMTQDANASPKDVELQGCNDDEDDTEKQENKDTAASLLSIQSPQKQCQVHNMHHHSSFIRLCSS